jgi:carbamoyltransferase
MNGAYLGPEYSNADVLKTVRKFGAKFEFFESYQKLTEYTAEQIAQNKVVGWFRGRMEFGPRALGNRSILADARNLETQKKLNLKIKFREGFRPFAPSVLEEDCGEYFTPAVKSPYMLLVVHVVEKLREKLPENYLNLDLMEKLYAKRSQIQAITHCDFSARIQTVDKNTNPDYHKLISEFKNLTGTGIIVNTSFNVRGEPIVCTPDQAFACFMRTDMDILVMQDYVFIKNDQNLDKENFNQTFKPD